MSEIYKNYRIDFNPPPIPSRACDWQFVHVDYDGPPDPRRGTAASLEDCKQRIDELEDT